MSMVFVAGMNMPKRIVIGPYRRGSGGVTFWMQGLEVTLPRKDELALELANEVKKDLQKKWTAGKDATGTTRHLKAQTRKRNKYAYVDSGGPQGPKRSSKAFVHSGKLRDGIKVKSGSGGLASVSPPADRIMAVQSMYKRGWVPFGIDKKVIERVLARWRKRALKKKA